MYHVSAKAAIYGCMKFKLQPMGDIGGLPRPFLWKPNNLKALTCLAFPASWAILIIQMKEAFMKLSLVTALLLSFAVSTALAQPMPLETARGGMITPPPVPIPVPLTPPPISLPQKEMIAIYGHGNSKCSEYVDYAESGQEQISKNYQIWLNGFISAYNTMVSNTGNVTNGKKSEELMRWIDAYCRDNPENFFQRATIELLRALETKQF